MVRGVERLAQRVEFGEALLGQGVPQLVDRHAEAFGDRAAFGLTLGGGEAEGERIEARQEFLEQAGRGELPEFFAVALVATLLVLLIGLAAEDRVAEAGDFAFEFGDAGGGVGRRGFGGGSVGQGLIFRSGVFR